MKKILCMGSINMDLVMYAEKLPVSGQTLVTDNFQTFPGGKGGNQSVAASMLGGDVRFLTKLGDDAFSEQLTQGQQSHGVCMDYVLQEKGKTAGIAMIMVDKSGQNSILFTPGANALLKPEDVSKHMDAFNGCDILLITMEISPETVYEAIRIAKSRGMLVVLDPAPVPSLPIPHEIAQMVDYVKPNETEAEAITKIAVTDEQQARKTLKALREYGFKHPILSLGKQGILTYVQDEFFREAVIDLPVLDTTAAGDVFLGAFVAALSRDESFVECLRFGQTAASLSITRKGAQTSIPTLEEVKELYAISYK